MNLSLWLLQFEKDPSRCRGCREGIILLQILGNESRVTLTTGSLPYRWKGAGGYLGARRERKGPDKNALNALIAIKVVVLLVYLNSLVAVCVVDVKKPSSNACKLSRCQFDRFTKDLFHYVTPFLWFYELWLRAFCCRHSLQRQLAIANLRASIDFTKSFLVNEGATGCFPSRLDISQSKYGVLWFDEHKMPVLCNRTLYQKVFLPFRRIRIA